jgi:pentatricopeptide repeat protein
MRTDIARLRLRTFRKLLKLTQAEFAARCGVSYPYILAVETGQRPVTEALAKRILFSTGLSPRWLLGKEGSNSKPLTLVGAFNVEESQRKRKSALRMEVVPSEDQRADIHHLCHELTQLIEAASRKGQFGMAVYLFREMVDAMTSQLRLKSALENEAVESLEKRLFSYESNDSVYRGKFERGEREKLWRLLSPTAAKSWAQALLEPESLRINFTRQLKMLDELVNESFALQQPGK